MPIIVCIDTNIFVRETHLLRKKAGPPLIHWLRAADGRFLIPEILRKEYVDQSIAMLREERDSIEESFDRLQSLIGSRDDYQLPSEGQVREAVESRLREMARITDSVAMTDELLLASSRRVLSKRRPVTKTDHAFKDCVIWESILTLPRGSDVRLVSRDKGFHEKGALHPQLHEDATSLGLSVTWSEDLESILKELQAGKPAPINFGLVNDRLAEGLRPVYEQIIARWSVSEMSGNSQTTLGPYYTEHANRIYSTFVRMVQVGAASPNNEEFRLPKVVLYGSFSWYPDEGRLTDLQVEREQLIALDGSLITEVHTQFATGVISLGRRSLPFKTRGSLFGAG